MLLQDLSVSKVVQIFTIFLNIRKFQKSCAKWVNNIKFKVKVKRQCFSKMVLISATSPIEVLSSTKLSYLRSPSQRWWLGGRVAASHSVWSCAFLKVRGVWELINSISYCIKQKKLHKRFENKLTLCQFWKTFSGVFKRGLVLIFQIKFSRFLFFLYYPPYLPKITRQFWRQIS